MSATDGEAMFGHECPVCRQPISHVKLFCTSAFGRFRCRTCGSLLGVNVPWRFMVVLVPAAGLALLFRLVEGNAAAAGWGWVVGGLVGLLGLILFFDRAKAYERCAVRCPKCGYDLRGQVVDRCPECGEEKVLAVVPLPVPSDPSRRRGMILLLILVGMLALTVGMMVAKVQRQKAATARRVNAPPRPRRLMPSEVPADLAEKLERIYQAVSVYRRDLGRWPDDVQALVGYALPNDFVMPARLTYRAVPQDTPGPVDWVLVISEPLNYDRSGERLPTPHRLILRLSGNIEFLPAAAAEELVPDAPAVPAEP
ncbi:MAG TPA: hypothetical protein PKK06_03240 [Phycisphaerae bacterium]|nr:hypothetical protein [Phycisphaerae bacterium]